MAEESKFVGRRIICDGYRGTVKYFGEVPPTSGEWLGVEWDDENRGKHNGSLDGVNYFVCSSPKSGSFVRVKKVDFGMSVVEALRMKYSDTQQFQDMHVVGKGKKTEVELVGADNILKLQSCFEKLTHAVLCNHNVNGPDKDVPLYSFTPNIIQLDLSGSLVAAWEDVARIIQNLKRLEILALSENHFKMPCDLISLTPSFSSIKELFLNKMKMSWEEISTVMKMFSNLEILHICQNSISSLRVDNGIDLLSCYGNIALLGLHGNDLTDWNDLIQSLGALPRLSTLILTDNKFTEIRFDDNQAESKSKNFPSLKSLHLTENQINDIASINALNRLPVLEDLRFKSNPVFEGWTSFDSRQELIARIASLTFLNGSPVTEKERKAAERAFIKKFTQEWVAAGGSADGCDSNKLDEAFLTRHPRYFKLIKVYGAPESTVDKKSMSLKDSLVSLSFKCPNDSSKNIITKKLPGTMTIGKVKGLLSRLYKIDSADQKLSYLDTKNDREIPLDDDLRQLSFYSVANGDTIYVRW